MSYPGAASFSVSATNYGRNVSDAYYALTGTGGGIPPGPVEITGNLTVDGNSLFKQAVTCEAAVEIQGALTGAAATFSGAVSANSISSATTGTFAGGVTATTVVASSALGTQGGLTVGGNVIIQNSSGVNMSGGTITGAGSVQADEIFTSGPVKFGRLATVYVGTPSNPTLTGGQLTEVGVVSLEWDGDVGAFRGTFIAPNGVTNNPMFFSIINSSLQAAVLLPLQYAFNVVPPNVNLTLIVPSSNGAPGATLTVSYLFFHLQATPS